LLFDEELADQVSGHGDEKGKRLLNLIGDWKVIQLLGSGAQADAYLVESQQESDSKAVLKLLKPWSKESKSSSENAQRNRFAAEVGTLAFLGDDGVTGIVPVIDHALEVSSSEQPWYVMPYYSRGPLRRDSGDNGAAFAEKYEGDISRVCEIAVQLAGTLHGLHIRDTVHRDVHTGNVFLGDDGTAILGDFGIVYSARMQDSHLSGESESFGPWRWRPPELKSGSLDKRRPAADVYMLGGLVYELLSGGNYLEMTVNTDGRFVHELDHFNLNKWVDDSRVELLNIALRGMLSEKPEVRFSASQAKEEFRFILNPQDPSNLSNHKRLERQARLVSQSRTSSVRKLSDFIDTRTESAERDVEIVIDKLRSSLETLSSEATNEGFSCFLGDRQYSHNLRNELPGVHNVNNIAGACISVVVDFGPIPKITKYSNVVIGSEFDGADIVGKIFDSPEGRKFEICKKLAPNSTSLINAAVEAVKEEFERLQDEVENRVEEMLRQNNR